MLRTGSTHCARSWGTVPSRMSRSTWPSRRASSFVISPVEEEAYGPDMPSSGGLPKCGAVQVEAELVAVAAEAEAVAVNKVARGRRKMARRTPERRAVVSSSVGGGGWLLRTRGQPGETCVALAHASQLVRAWACAMTGRELQFLSYPTNKMISFWAGSIPEGG